MKSQVFAEAVPRFVLLAVDDKPDNLYVLKQLVAASLPECTLVGAESVEEGLRKARETSFDGILLDVQMPGMDGVEMCRRLKSEEATRESPVILITSHQSSPKLRAAGLEAGADDFISRPIDNVELAARIRTMLRIRSAENELRRINRDLEGIVAERTRQIEKAMRRQVIRNDLVDIFLTSPEEETFDRVLQLVLSITESRRGLIGHLDEQGDLVLVATTNNVWKDSNLPGTRAVLPVESWRSFWAKALVDRQPILWNAPASVPEGHVGIERAMIVPLLDHQELMGAFAAANKADEYTADDLEILEMLARHASPIIRTRLQRDRQEKQRRQAEEALAQLNRELEDKNRELASLIYVTSHDLRSPLVNIQGFSQELEHSCTLIRSAAEEQGAKIVWPDEVSTALRDEIPQAVHYILASVNKMDHLLSGLLRLSRLGRAALRPESLDISEMLTHVVAAHEFQIKESGATVIVDPLPPCRGDADMINQVFSNLLDNALKYLDPQRPGIIRVSGTAEADHAVYRIEDNGIGIPESQCQKVFEVFYRIRPEGAVEGDGLGLPSVRRIVERHGGRVWLESREGEGCTFFVTLPKA